jgi:TonB family protein
LLSVALAACATAGLPQSSDPLAPRSHVVLDFGAAPNDDAQLVRPVALDPRLPSVDRIASQLHYELGDTAQATLKLCVAPAGNVTSATITQSSSSTAFDGALIHDITSWRFAATPGLANVQSCSVATVVYRT